MFRIAHCTDGCVESCNFDPCADNALSSAPKRQLGRTSIAPQVKAANKREIGKIIWWRHFSEVNDKGLHVLCLLATVSGVVVVGLFFFQRSITLERLNCYRNQIRVSLPVADGHRGLLGVDGLNRSRGSGGFAW